VQTLSVFLLSSLPVDFLFHVSEIFQDEADLGPIREIDLTTFAESTSSYNADEPAPEPSGARSRVTWANGATSNDGNVLFPADSSVNKIINVIKLF
jgi:hypothetical protein